MCHFNTETWNADTWISFIGLIVLTLTLLVLIFYTVKTNVIAIQTRHTNLRPVILRDGYIHNWESIVFTYEKGEVSGEPLRFMILKNIAASIRGYIVKDRIKYKLYFYNEINKAPTADQPQEVKGRTKISVYPAEIFGWLTPNQIILAIYKVDDGQQCEEPNKIALFYNDIEGNPYHTIEDVNFIQKCFAGNP